MRVHSRFMMMVFSIALMSVSVNAQLSLTVDSVDTGAFPDITYRVITKNGDLLKKDLDSSNFKISEDGIRQQPLHYSCPAATQNFSMAITIGVGSTMTAGMVASATGTASRLVDGMDGVIDEASIVTYDGNVFERQQITSIKPWLQTTLSSITTTGGANHIWDGAYGGVLNLGNNGVQITRAMVFLSNGKGDGGTKDVIDVVNLANSMNIVVYCIGISAANNDRGMKELAAQTGGEYFASADLAVQEILNAISGTPEYCELTYTTNNLCRDGIDRNFNVQVRVDNDSVNASGSFPLAADPSSNTQVTFKVVNTTVTAGTDAEVHMELVTPVTDQRLYGGTITLAYDTSLLKLKEIAVDGFMAEGMSASVVNTATGGVITFGGSAHLDGSGTLFDMLFMTAEVKSRAVVDVGITDVTLTRGCLEVQTQDGKVTINPKKYELTTKANPVIFNWDDGNKRYNPDPASVVLEITNSGDLPVSNLTATMAEAPEVRIAWGGSRTVQVVPADLEPGERGKATWLVQALPRADEKTARINAVVISDEGATTDRDLFLNIKPATSAVRTVCSVDEVIVQAGSYIPDPADVTAVVSSAGTQDSPAGDVTIVLPVELTLDGAPATQTFDVMTSGASTTLTWPLRYPDVDVDTDYSILLVTSATGFADDTCYVTMTVPALKGAVLTATCLQGPDTLLFDQNLGKYVPDPFTVWAEVVNTGNEASDEVYAEIMLPPGIVLETGEQQVQSDVVQVGDTVVFAWKARPISAVGGCQGRTNAIGYRAMDKSVLIECSKDIFFEGYNFEVTVDSYEPATLDTVVIGTEVDFSVTSTDPKESSYQYIWQLNGQVVGDDQDSYTETFNDLGDQLVTCSVLNSCAQAGDGDTLMVSWNFHVSLTSAVERTPAMAADFALLGNYPNPFNPSTVIEFRIPAGSHQVVLDVIDAAGRLVQTLTDEQLIEGRYSVSFDAAGLTSGSYFARLRSGSFQQVLPMMLMK